MTHNKEVYLERIPDSKVHGPANMGPTYSYLTNIRIQQYIWERVCDWRNYTRTVGRVKLRCMLATIQHCSDVIMSAMVSHWRLDCLLSRWLRRRSTKASKHRVTGPCEVNPPITGGFSSQKASDTEMFPFDDVIMKPPSRVCGHAQNDCVGWYGH